MKKAISLKISPRVGLRLRHMGVLPGCAGRSLGHVRRCVAPHTSPIPAPSVPSAANAPRACWMLSVVDVA